MPLLESVAPINGILPSCVSAFVSLTPELILQISDKKNSFQLALSKWLCIIYIYICQDIEEHFLSVFAQYF